MDWIQPLELEKFIIQIFSGDFQYFTGIALFVIAGLSGYFRMTGLFLMYMVLLFFLMFQGYVDNSIYFLIISIGGLLIGFWIKNIVQR